MLEAGTCKLQLLMCMLREPTDHLGVRKILGALERCSDPGGPAAVIDFHMGIELKLYFKQNLQAFSPFPSFDLSFPYSPEL